MLNLYEQVHPARYRPTHWCHRGGDGTSGCHRRRDRQKNGHTSLLYNRRLLENTEGVISCALPFLCQTYPRVGLVFLQ